jgi:hypothetical protein
MSELSALRAYHIDNGLPDTILISMRSIFVAWSMALAGCNSPAKSGFATPISRASGNISNLPAQPLGLSGAQKSGLNLAVAARVAFAGFLRVGEFPY